jgi:hypothetical protein
MQEDVDNWPPINKLLAPLGTHSFKYDRNISTEGFGSNNWCCSCQKSSGVKKCIYPEETIWAEASQTGTIH